MLDLAQNGKCSYTHIFIDQNMPIKDGLTATREIRELICQNNVLQHLKIIGCSGNSDTTYQKNGLKAGMDKVL